MTPRACLPVIAVLALASIAHAQDEDDDTTETATFTFTADPALDPIGIDNCISRLAADVRITGTYKGTTVPSSDLRLTASSSSTRCDRTTLSACPIGSAGDDCFCIAEVENASTVTRTITLSSYLGNVCAGTSNASLFFFVEYYQPEEGLTMEDTKTSDSVEIEVDLTRPSPPTGVPEVRAAENALVVKPTAVTDADLDRYEVCAIPLAAVDEVDPETEPGANTNDGQRGIYATASARCDTFSKSELSDGFRLGGLENDVTYQVITASIDTAGNRSANSAPNTGTPADVLDFAEYYYLVCKGEAPDPADPNYAAQKAAYDARACEEGGCNATGTSAPLLAALGALLLGLRRRRRNTCA